LLMLHLMKCNSVSNKKITRHSIFSKTNEKRWEWRIWAAIQPEISIFK
jgi:hypothetical protein